MITSGAHRNNQRTNYIFISILMIKPSFFDKSAKVNTRGILTTLMDEIIADVTWTIIFCPAP